VCLETVTNKGDEGAMGVVFWWLYTVVSSSTIWLLFDSRSWQGSVWLVWVRAVKMPSPPVTAPKLPSLHCPCPQCNSEQYGVRRYGRLGRYVQRETAPSATPSLSVLVRPLYTYYSVPPNLPSWTLLLPRYGLPRASLFTVARLKALLLALLLRCL